MEEKDLKKQNEELKKKLAMAENWIKKEIEGDKLAIAKEKNEEDGEKERRKYYRENARNLIISSVKNFLGDFIFSQTSEYVLENVISAEVLYYNQRHFKFTDGLGVITGYNKAIDYLIEENITKAFRSYAKKYGPKELTKNDLNEKTLNSVVNKGYTIGVGKLYSILSDIKENDNLYPFTDSFGNFLNVYSYIKEVVLSDSFFELTRELVDSELFGEKRHIGKISFEETKFARKILIGNLIDKKCLIYKLLKIGTIDL